MAIYIWDLEKPDTTYVTVDIKPEKIDELNEVITATKFSPNNDYNILYGTSKSDVRLIDLRENSKCQKSGVSFVDPST